MIGGPELGFDEAEAYLINTARGAVDRTDARWFEALRQGIQSLEPVGLFRKRSPYDDHPLLRISTTSYASPPHRWPRTEGCIRDTKSSSRLATA